MKNFRETNVRKSGCFSIILYFLLAVYLCVCVCVCVLCVNVDLKLRYGLQLTSSYNHFGVGGSCDMVSLLVFGHI